MKAAPPMPPVQWLNAASLWDATVKEDSKKQRMPLLLRFRSERFMEDLGTRLGATTPDLSALLDCKEETDPSLKLYQPVHGRFYLVTARLVCQIGRESDFVPNSGKGDRVGFVLRRLRKETVEGKEKTWEDAWVSPPRHDVEPSWLEVSEDPQKPLATDEVLFAVFPLSFGAGEGRRRLLMGLVPASAQATFAFEKNPPSDNPKYVIRFVWHRTGGGEVPALPPLLSAPSEPFLMAAFDEPGAPVRPAPPLPSPAAQATR